ncbi:MAG: long-chain-fatty-acid--CoA ligase [Cytophagales bacterium]|nr:long-chain-fatty-acid--CoA ligase [Cytophagales bacterium]
MNTTHAAPLDRPHFKHWPKRLPHSIPLPETSLWHNLEGSAQRYPSKDAIVFLGTHMTYAQLADKALRMAAYLHQLGVQAGDRVVLAMQNCPQLIVTHFAILRLGAVVVPVNPMNKAEELKHYIIDPDTRVAVTTADLAAELAAASNALEPALRLAHLITTQFSDECDLGVTGSDAPPDAWLPWLLAPHAAPALAARAGTAGSLVHTWAHIMHASKVDAAKLAAALPVHRARPLDLAILPYTSGTTGLPKGCEHTHRSIMHNAISSGLWGNASAAIVGLVVVPMFHITGMVSVLHSSILQGATLVVMPRWDRDFAGRLISKHRVTHWTNIPTMVMDLLASPHFADYDLTSLVNIGGGGAAMPAAVAQRLLDAYGLVYVEGYGLTETAAPSHSNPPDRAKQQCLGIPFMSTDARVWNPDTKQECAVGEQGEIIMHGPEIFSGYWKRPDATADAFIEFAGKRFFRSGDIGRMDEDGYFFMTDRLKRMINASGFKVWPAEVEALMFKHEAIAEACVVASRDAYRGETVKAFVVLRQSHKGRVSESDIVAWCKNNMATYKAPRIIELMDALPKNGAGKTMWRTLQEAEMAKQ